MVVAEGLLCIPSPHFDLGGVVDIYAVNRASNGLTLFFTYLHAVHKEVHIIIIKAIPGQF